MSKPQSADRSKDWETHCLAESLSFSSLSRTRDDIWGHDIKRPYRIVLKPGYKPPACLDKGDKDALWHPAPGDIQKPVVVWDGFCPVALHEIVRECFDYAGTSPFIKVINSETMKVVPDDRDPRVLALRPRRGSGWGMNRVYNHIIELTFWARMFEGDFRTIKLYSDLLLDDAEEADSRDNFYRGQFFIQSGTSRKDIFDEHKRILSNAARFGLKKPPRSGPPHGYDAERSRRDKGVPRLCNRIDTLMEMGRLRLSDFPDGKPPESFYDAAMAKGAMERRERERDHARRFRSS